MDHRSGGHDDHVVALGLAVAGLPPEGAADAEMGPCFGVSRSAFAGYGAGSYTVVNDGGGGVSAPGDPSLLHHRLRPEDFSW